MWSRLCPLKMVLEDLGLVGAEAVWNNLRHVLGALAERLAVSSNMQWEDVGIRVSIDQRGHTEWRLWLVVTPIWL